MHRVIDLLRAPASIFAIFVAAMMVALDFTSITFHRAALPLFMGWVYLFYILNAVACFGIYKLVLRRHGAERFIVAILLCGMLHLVLILPPENSPGRFLARVVTN